MLGKIGSWFGGTAGKVWDVVKGPVEKAIKYAVSMILGIFRGIGSAWGALHGAASAALSAVEGFSKSVYNKLAHLFRVVIPAILRDAANLAAKVAKFAAHLATEVGKVAADLVKRITRAVKDATDWVVDKVYKPLWARTVTLFNWVTGRGEQMWHLITHPDKLAAILLLPLVYAFLKLSEDAIAAIVEPVFKAWLKTLPRFLGLVERIVDDIF